jgi:sugar lactone lactonase YvrE
VRHNGNVTHYRTLLLFVSAPLFAQQYVISTIAGNGVAGVSFNNPTSVAVDAAGDLYVSDWSGYIRKIWAKNGATTIVAGTGIPAFPGFEEQQALNTSIGHSISLTLDPAGNLYFTDGDNNRICRVDAVTGILTTIAGTGATQDSGDGGPALKAGVRQPTGITLDSAGNLYFSSSWARVRKVAAHSGVIETIAGQQTTSFGGDNGPAIDALFWDPIPSAVSPNGNLYITDYENSRIRVIAASTGIVTTVAGSGSCAAAPPFWGITCQGGFAGDGGPARTAALNHAQGAALDANGNLFIADSINHRIRRVDGATGLISTIAGNGVNGFSGDGGPAVAAEISFPVGIAVDRTGKVYFADENNQRIRVLTPVGPQSRREPRR